MHLINADLHSHSNVSDGTLPPEAIAARARAQGVELWALTDHDEVGGQARARDAALAARTGRVLELDKGTLRASAPHAKA